MLGCRLAFFAGLLEEVATAVYAGILLGEALSIPQIIGGVPPPSPPSSTRRPSRSRCSGRSGLHRGAARGTGRRVCLRMSHTRLSIAGLAQLRDYRVDQCRIICLPVDGY